VNNLEYAACKELVRRDLITVRQLAPLDAIHLTNRTCCADFCGGSSARVGPDGLLCQSPRRTRARPRSQRLLCLLGCRFQRFGQRQLPRSSRRCFPRGMAILYSLHLWHQVRLSVISCRSWSSNIPDNRQWLARIIPRSLTLATGAGIGLFIALIGLGSAGLGVVGGDYTNLVGLGGCTAECTYPFSLIPTCGLRVLLRPISLHFYLLAWHLGLLA
jgi:hypothetical protein